MLSTGEDHVRPGGSFSLTGSYPWTASSCCLTWRRRRGQAESPYFSHHSCPPPWDREQMFPYLRVVLVVLFLKAALLRSTLHVKKHNSITFCEYWVAQPSPKSNFRTFPSLHKVPSVTLSSQFMFSLPAPGNLWSAFYLWRFPFSGNGSLQSVLFCAWLLSLTVNIF